MKKSTLLLILLSLWLPSCGEYEEETIDTGYKGLAKIDHFLAARRMSEQMDWTAYSYAGVPDFPPPPDATLIVPVVSLQSEGVLGELDRWVAAGGNLIAYLEMPDDRPAPRKANPDWDSFLDYFEFEVAAVKDLKKEDLASLDWDRTGAKDSLPGRSLTLDSIKSDRDEPYETKVETHFLIRDVEGEDAVYSSLESYDYGDGTMTVLATAKPFSNEAISEREHATLLHDLIAQGQGGEVWFVYSTRTSFFALLWDRGPYAMLALGIAIVVLVWWAARGFGPRFTRGTDANPKLDEHLLASGAFFIKHRADTVVVREHRAALFRKVARALNLPLNTPHQDLLAAARADQLLDGEQLAALSQPLSDKTLLITLRNLQLIEQKL